ncbi:MAG: aspartate aminotransferase family protein [Dehalococcoidales bacterium]|nr:aspartate aminotransferase family protein [Dehalococcoidales bacterium]
MGIGKQAKVDWKELEKKYYMRTFEKVRLPVVLVRGKGAYVWDEDGKQYLDFVAGWAVNCLGHAHPVVVKAIGAQAKKLIHTSNQFYTIPQLQLAELLVKNSCLQRVFFANSGLEANEGAVKLARRYGKLKRNGAYEVITATGSFHGRSLAMTAATGQESFHKPYLPLPEGFINVKFNDIEALKKVTTEKTAAVMLELIEAESGVNVHDLEYIKAVRRWCDEKGILLILDEIQTGIGRLGTLFGYQSFGIEPDIMTLAKGLAGGVPIGAVLAKEHCAVFAPGDHGSTFGGNPLACAAGYATLDYIIRHDIPGNAKKTGQYLRDRLLELKGKYHFITEVRGMGLLLAVEFNAELGERVTLDCLRAGLLVNRVKPNAIRLIPPLIIGKKEVDEAIGILDGVFSGINRS